MAMLSDLTWVLHHKKFLPLVALLAPAPAEDILESHRAQRAPWEAAQSPQGISAFPSNEC
jgi:hypothetical protein